MKRQLVVLFLAMFVTAGTLYAADAPPAQLPAASQPDAAELMAKAAEQAQRNATQYIESRDPVVSLSDAQKTEISDALTEYYKARVEFELKNAGKTKVLQAAMDKATAANDQDSMASVQQEQQALREPMGKLYEKFRTRFDKILTLKQKGQWDDWMLSKSIEAMAAPIELTAQQLKALKAAGNGQDDNTKWQAIQEAVNNMLTPQQKMQVKKHQAMQRLRWTFYGIKFSPEQIQQGELFCDKLLKDPELSVNELASKLVEKMETLLTPEQKEARKKVMGGE